MTLIYCSHEFAKLCRLSAILMRCMTLTYYSHVFSKLCRLECNTDEVYDTYILFSYVRKIVYLKGFKELQFINWMNQSTSMFERRLSRKPGTGVRDREWADRRGPGRSHGERGKGSNPLSSRSSSSERRKDIATEIGKYSLVTYSGFEWGMG